MSKLLNRLRAHRRQRSAVYKNAVFIWIPKAAGTSVFDMLESHGAVKAVEVSEIQSKWPKQNGVVTFGHMSYHQLVCQGIVSTDFDQSAFKFAICRNPYDRAVSLFTYLRRHKRVPSEMDFSEFIRSIYTNELPPIGLYNVSGWSQCNPQVEWLRNIAVNKVIKFENLEDGLNEVFPILGIYRRTIRHLNAATRADTLVNYLSCENVKLINEIYSDDFKEFGYEVLRGSQSN